MKLKLDLELLKKVTDEKIRDIDRYYSSLLYVLGMRRYLETHKELNAKFIGAEFVLKRSDGTPLNPDMCIQIRRDSSGVLGLPVEIKSSLSEDRAVKKEIEKMQRYDETLSGWATRRGNMICL